MASLTDHLTELWVRDFVVVWQISLATSGKSRDIVVGVVTRYGLDSPEIESWWGTRSPLLSRPVWYPPSPLYNEYGGILGCKSSGGDDNHPPPLTPRLKKD